MMILLINNFLINNFLSSKLFNKIWYFLFEKYNWNNEWPSYSQNLFIYLIVPQRNKLITNCNKIIFATTTTWRLILMLLMTLFVVINEIDFFCFNALSLVLILITLMMISYFANVNVKPLSLWNLICFNMTKWIGIEL